MTYANTISKLSLVAYWSIGDSNVNGLEFSGFSMLKYVGLILKNDTERNYFSSCFSGTGLTSIPQGLFDNCVKAFIFNNVFYSVPITSIPVGLFDHCTEAREFKGAFEKTLLSSIPEDIFKYNVIASNFNLCFASTKITSVPERLFYYCSNAVVFGGFDNWGKAQGCFSRSLLESVPANLFINNKKAQTLMAAFNIRK